MISSLVSGDFAKSVVGCCPTEFGRATLPHPKCASLTLPVAADDNENETTAAKLGLRSVSMAMWLWTVGVLMTVIPWAIAYKRKCANFALIDLLSFFLSLTIIGWVVLMAWAIWGKSDPQEFSRQTGEVS
jgi:hypothetical protein